MGGFIHLLYRADKFVKSKIKATAASVRGLAYFCLALFLQDILLINKIHFEVEVLPWVILL